MLKLTTGKHEASRGLSATTELLVSFIGTPSYVSRRKPFVVQVSGSHTHAVCHDLARRFGGIAGTKFVPVSPDQHPHAHCQQFFSHWHTKLRAMT